MDFNSLTGSLDKTTVETSGLVAQSTYTAVEGQNKIDVGSSNAEVGIEFNVVKTISTSLAVDEEITVTAGSGSLNVVLTAEGSPVEGKLISVKVNDEITLTQQPR